MSINNLVHVSIGEVKIGSNQDTLMASLGSCVGIGFLWKRKNLFGLAHCLLPEAPQSDKDKGLITGRYVDQAIPSLFKLMNIEKKNRSEIDAILVGGGNMTAPQKTDSKKLIGNLNIQAAEKYLKEFGIQIVQKDLGEEHGRKIYIYCETGTFLIKKISRIGHAQAS